MTSCADVKRFWQILFLLLLAGIIYLSMRPSPAISTVPWFPHPLAAWFDRHNFMANVLGFGVLAGVGLLAFAIQSTSLPRANPPGKPGWKAGLVVAAVCGLVVFIELIQLRLPKRVCDWRDIAAGWSGAAMAWGILKSIRAPNTAKSASRILQVQTSESNAKRGASAESVQGRYRRILGVRFFAGSAEQAVKMGLRGGLVVMPAAPALIELQYDEDYREALLNADLAISDSGFMVLLWRLLTREQLIRVSGLEYLKLLLARLVMHEPGAVMWIMPTSAAQGRNLEWLRTNGFPAREDDCYLAPVYPKGKLHDQALLERIRAKKPRHIIVSLGGGTQERLGLFLKRELNYRPGIHCIGAAIAFLSGDQAKIPAWADHLFLGWFFRCLSEPMKFVPRYWHARRLVSLMLRYGAEMPPLVAHET